MAWHGMACHGMVWSLVNNSSSAIVYHLVGTASAECIDTERYQRARRTQKRAEGVCRQLGRGRVGLGGRCIDPTWTSSNHVVQNASPQSQQHPLPRDGRLSPFHDATVCAPERPLRVPPPPRVDDLMRACSAVRSSRSRQASAATAVSPTSQPIPPNAVAIAEAD